MGRLPEREGAILSLNFANQQVCAARCLLLFPWKNCDSFLAISKVPIIIPADLRRSV